MSELSPYEAHILHALGVACCKANGPVSTNDVMREAGGDWKGGDHRNALVRLRSRGLAERTAKGRGRWEAVVR